jgi:hypothetical protein
MTAPAQKPRIPPEGWRAKNNVLRQRLQGVDASDPRYTRITNRINFNRQQAGLKPKSFAAPTPQAPAPQPTPEPTPIAPTPEVKNPDYMKSIFPDVNPNQYVGDYLNTPGYNWRLQQGQKALDRILSREGLTSSGAELQKNQDLAAQLSAEEYDRALGISQGIVSNKMTQGSQLQNLLQGEASRRDQLGQNQVDNYLKYLTLALGQNPLQYTYQGLLQGSNLGYQYGQDKGQAVQNAVQRQIPGHSGGGSPIPPFQAPFPSRPDFSQADASSIFGGSSTYGDILGGLGNIVGSFL